MTYFDVADIQDLRLLVRKGVGEEAFEEGESKANGEIEGWIAEVLARGDGEGRLRDGVAERVAEIQREAEREKGGGR